jgi:hypothetical protein
MPKNARMSARQIAIAAGNGSCASGHISTA